MWIILLIATKPSDEVKPCGLKATVVQDNSSPETNSMREGLSQVVCLMRLAEEKATQLDL